MKLGAPFRLPNMPVSTEIVSTLSFTRYTQGILDGQEGSDEGSPRRLMTEGQVRSDN